MHFEAIAPFLRALIHPHLIPRMTSTLEPRIELPALAGDDELFKLQLRVAIRADKLARDCPDRRRPAWFAWIQAEREVLSALAATSGPESDAPAAG